MDSLLNSLKFLSGTNFLKEIKINRTIGAGNNAVYEVSYQGQTVAMKVISGLKINIKGDCDKEFKFAV
jgi:hypothetical protein